MDPCNVNKWNQWNEKYCYLERLYKLHTGACIFVSVNSGTFYNISCFWLSNLWGLTLFELHKKLQFLPDQGQCYYRGSKYSTHQYSKTVFMLCSNSIYAWFLLSSIFYDNSKNESAQGEWLLNSVKEKN
jgi:hypothetical protein